MSYHGEVETVRSKKAHINLPILSRDKYKDTNYEQQIHILNGNFTFVLTLMQN